MYDRLTSSYSSGCIHHTLLTPQSVNADKLPQGWTCSSSNSVKANGYLVRVRSLTHQMTGVEVTHTLDKSLKVDWHPAHVLHGTNHNVVLPRNQEELEEAERKLQKLLKPICSLDGSKKYTYVEITANIRKPTSQFMAVLEGVTHPQLKNWNRYAGPNQEGLCFGSKGKNSATLTVYNKVKEMKRKRKGKHLGEMVRHLTRVELALSGKKIKDYFGGNELERLNYDQARSILLKEIAKLDTKLVPVSAEDCTDEVKLIHRMYHSAYGIPRDLVSRIVNEHLAQAGKGDSTLRAIRNKIAAAVKEKAVTSLTDIISEASLQRRSSMSAPERLPLIRVTRSAR